MLFDETGSTVTFLRMYCLVFNPPNKISDGDRVVCRTERVKTAT